MKIVDVTPVWLQGKQLQVLAQRQILAGLFVDLCQLTDGQILGPLTPDAIAELRHMNNEEEHVVPIIVEPPTLAQDQQPNEGTSVAMEPLCQQGAELVRNGHVSQESMRCSLVQLTCSLGIAVALSWSDFTSCPCQAKEVICWIAYRS
ncbi:hypothetical protein MHU86_15057 [Fragilaria crotonensis]|nr:hypothetical protein MHU86_15057 [Fragilaria crotonensis]